MTAWHEADIIKGCWKNKKQAQTALYQKYVPMLRGVTYRYLSQPDVINDLVHDAIFVIFSKIKQFSGSGSFEGWMKRIMINTILTYFKKQKQLQPFDETFMSNKEEDQNENFFVGMSEKISQQEVLDAINNLSIGYKLVFNMYVFDNYSHKEIAKILNISQNTSKTQLMRARKLLRKQLTILLNQRNFEIN